MVRLLPILHSLTLPRTHRPHIGGYVGFVLGYAQILPYGEISHIPKTLSEMHLLNLKAFMKDSCF